MKIAVPSQAPGGLHAHLSAHFGHCEFYTLVTVEGQDITAVEILPNKGHVQGGCMNIVNLLSKAGVQALLAGGMGARPLAGFQRMGIKVYFSEKADSVVDAILLLNSGRARKFGPAQVCSGGGDCQKH